MGHIIQINGFAITLPDKITANQTARAAILSLIEHLTKTQYSFFTTKLQVLVNAISEKIIAAGVNAQQAVDNLISLFAIITEARGQKQLILSMQDKTNKTESNKDCPWEQFCILLSLAQHLGTLEITADNIEKFRILSKKIPRTTLEKFDIFYLIKREDLINGDFKKSCSSAQQWELILCKILTSPNAVISRLYALMESDNYKQHYTKLVVQLREGHIPENVKLPEWYRNPHIEVIQDFLANYIPIYIATDGITLMQAFFRWVEDYESKHIYPHPFSVIEYPLHGKCYLELKSHFLTYLKNICCENESIHAYYVGVFAHESEMKIKNCQCHPDNTLLQKKAEILLSMCSFINTHAVEIGKSLDLNWIDRWIKNEYPNNNPFTILALPQGVLREVAASITDKAEIKTIEVFKRYLANCNLTIRAIPQLYEALEERNNLLPADNWFRRSIVKFNYVYLTHFGQANTDRTTELVEVNTAERNSPATAQP